MSVVYGILAMAALIWDTIPAIVGLAGDRGLMEQGYTAIDASSVVVTTATNQGPVSGYVEVDARLQGLGTYYFTHGPQQMGAELALDPNTSPDMQFVEQYEYQGGTLRLGQGSQHIGEDNATYAELDRNGRARFSPVNIALWEGVHSCLFTFRYSGEPVDLLPAFEQLSISETGSGLTAIPNNPLNVSFLDGPALVIDLPGAGILESRQRTKVTNRQLPTHAGTKTAGGDLYAGRSGAPTKFWLLVGATAVTQFVPTHEAPVCDIEDSLAALRVEWQPSS